jgi:MFS family permease
VTAAPPRSAPIPGQALLLGAALFMLVAATNVITPLLPQIRDDFGVSISTAGWVIGSFGLARLMLDLPAGVLVDWFGPRRLSFVALAILIAASLVGLASPSLEVLIAARIGSGVAVAMLATIILSALAATSTPANRGKVMALFPTANNASTAVYPLVGGFIGEFLGWRATFGLTAGLALLGGLFLLPVLLRVDLPRRGTPVRAARPDPRVLYGRPRAVAIVATNVGVMATIVHRQGFRNTVLPLYAATALGLGGISIATAIALMAVTGLIVGVPGGILGDRIGRRRVIITGLMAIAVGDLIFLLTGDLLTFLLASALIGLGDFFPSSQTALLAEIVPPELRTRALSGYRFSADLGGFLGPVVLATVMDQAGARTAIIVVAALLFGSALVARFGVPATVDLEPDEVGAGP